MRTYSIKDLEHLSGIKAHTLRIWEQRYSFIKPRRTNTNIRFYNDDDLKLVLNISLLKENGFKISRISQMNREEICKEVTRLTEKSFKYPEQIHSLTFAMLDLDEERFEKTLSTSIIQLGFEKTMLSIVYPFLYKIGALWQTGVALPGHEHFISNLVRQKLMVAIDGQYTSKKGYNKKYMLFLPEGEMHELGLLFACYVIKSRNNKAVYLGQNLPFPDLKMACGIHQPDYLVTLITSVFEQGKVQKYLYDLAKNFPYARILVSGFQVMAQGLKLHENIKAFHSKEAFVEYIEKNSKA